ncbi:MAG: Na+/H+ antiporter subunit E [Gemmatimonadetes bacterium]|nr:Na+/H+ antiporter subunit E [Gemmatimonadota bacterium]MBT5142987.1 Na+/H+ antiporter subunit E [Gemmatimonadota bacterium]MBT5588253.1 Na+/H+ antiporter subunit E [Gemmatimonadota bacterium]MBT5962652.1 Na+/H+ antiporter subunit E [Gemmatimonadota bacterium]MBT6628502.1 Na+/H+ antiporter subunit E [Gemmatimonadota bacterium]
MGRLLSLIVLLFGTWLLWSGIYQPLTIGFGVVSCLFVAWLSARMGIADEEGTPIHLVPRLILYVPWLVWAIVKSNIDVARRILRPSLPISPRLVKIKASQQNDLGRVVYANSITLTPGTVTVDIEGDELTIHALTAEAEADLLTGEMDRRVTNLQGAGG